MAPATLGRWVGPGKGLIRVHPENGPKVSRVFELYAYHTHTLDSLQRALREEGVGRLGSERLSSCLKGKDVF